MTDQEILRLNGDEDDFILCEADEDILRFARKLLAASAREEADEIARLRALLGRCLERLEDDFWLIANDRGPIGGGLEGAISRGEEPVIAAVRAELAIAAKEHHD